MTRLLLVLLLCLPLHGRHLLTITKMQRFTGTCESFADIDVDDLVHWITAISFSEWPQQWKVDEQLRPAMVTSHEWHGFGKRGLPVILALTELPTYQWMLSVVMPGHFIDPHKDAQAPYWRARIHVPLTTNRRAVMIMDDGEHHMVVGKAYKVNTMATHALANRGETPRIHFMFDVRGVT